MSKLAMLYVYFAIATAIGAKAFSSSSHVSAATTLSLFVGPGLQGRGFVGEIVNANGCGTTIGMACTSGELSAVAGASLPCQGEGTIYVTYGPSSYEFQNMYSTDGDVGTTTKACTLSGTTEAVCTYSYEASLLKHGKKTSQIVTSTLTGSDVVFAPVAITSGAAKLSNNAACTSTSSANGAAATAIIEVYKILVVPGAMMVAGMLG